MSQGRESKMLLKIQGKSCCAVRVYKSLLWVFKEKEMNSFSCIVLSQGQSLKTFIRTLVKDNHLAKNSIWFVDPNLIFFSKVFSLGLGRWVRGKKHCCSSRGSLLRTHTRQPITPCNSNSRASSVLFRPPSAHVCMWHITTHTQAHAHIHIHTHKNVCCCSAVLCFV